MTWTGKTTPGQFSLDEYAVSYHGYAHTHMDALCHMFYKGKMYNGFPQETVTDVGATKNAITNFKNGIMSRGILVDIPVLRGVPYLDTSVAIYPEDLEAWGEETGIKIGSGDIVFVRTGRWARRAARIMGCRKNSAGMYALREVAEGAGYRDDWQRCGQRCDAFPDSGGSAGPPAFPGCDGDADFR